MASLIVIALVIAVAGVLAGVFVAVSWTIRREDRAGTLSWDAPDQAAQSVRILTGYSRQE